MRTTTGLRVSAAAAGAVCALAVLPGGASAAFEPAFGTQCSGATSIAGRGASFQRQAQLAWGAQQLAPDPASAKPNGFGYASTGNGGCAAFKTGTDGGTAGVTYEPKGSGDGRAAVGAIVAGTAGSGVRDTAIHFAAADEPPTTPQLAAANQGPTTATTDDAVLLTVPVAQSSVAVVVKLPAGCTVPSFADHQISSKALEGVFAGNASYTKWGQVLPSITGADCATKPVQRVVRLDNSGTTFAFKNYLRDIDPTDFPATGQANNAWPNNTGDTAVVRGDTNGAGPQLDKLNGLAGGGIGYADLAAARARSFDTTVLPASSPDAGKPDPADTTFWLNVERKDGKFVSPALDDVSGTTATGSNCKNVTYADPATGKLPAVTESWTNVSGVSSTSDYSLCALTYALVWQDMLKANANRAADKPAYTQGQARAVKDYLGFILNSNGGQAALAPNGYQALPTIDSGTSLAVPGSVLDVAEKAQKSLTWNQQPVVDPPTGGGGTTTPPVTNPPASNPPASNPPASNPPASNPPASNPPATTTPAKVTPPATTPSTKPTPAAKPKVSVSKALGAKGRTITLTVSPSAAGRVTVSASTGSGKKKVTVGSGSASAKKSGALKLTIKPSSKGKKALRAGRSVKITFKVTFVDEDGTKTTTTKSVKVKIKR